jgi:DNA repair exonuclease SbcCD ATPase subunit
MIQTSLPRLRSRASFVRVALGSALALATLTGCQDRKAVAEAERLAAELAAATATRDSLAAIVGSADADKDRALTELAEASKFADQIDAELRQVRGLTSQVKPQTGDESGRAQAAAAREDILARLKTLRQRLNARTSELARTRDSIVGLRGEASTTAQLLGDLQSRLEMRDREIAAFETEVRELREANVRLTEEKVALTDTVRQVQTSANRVYYTVGTKRELLDRKLVREEGGSRLLLVTRIGETLVPSRDLDASYFTVADKRETITIPLPRADKSYRIVSRHDASLVESEQKEKDGSFRGTSVRITDPTRFWAASPYLIIVEK